MSLVLPLMADFQVMWESGRALWQGNYQSLYPLPLAGVFALLALLPLWASALVWQAGGLMVWVAVLKRSAPAWLLFTPVLILITMGQIDLFFLGLCTAGTPLSLALLTLKPQLFVLALPRLLTFTAAEWRRLGLWAAALYLPATLARPVWIGEWLAAVSRVNDARLAQNVSASFWSQPLFFLILLPLIPLIVRRNLNWRGLLLALNPGVLPYDYVMLAGASLWLIPLSWGLLFWYYSLPLSERWMWSLLGVAAVLLEPPLPAEQSLGGLWRRLRRRLPPAPAGP